MVMVMDKEHVNVGGRSEDLNIIHNHGEFRHKFEPLAINQWLRGGRMADWVKYKPNLYNHKTC